MEEDLTLETEILEKLLRNEYVSIWQIAAPRLRKGLRKLIEENEKYQAVEQEVDDAIEYAMDSR